MATVVTIMDGNGWSGNTDVIVRVDPKRRVLCWIPRDLWCNQLGDRINAAFRKGSHERLRAALHEHDLLVAHSLCLRREAIERAARGLTLTVPVHTELDFWYPLAPRLPLEDGRKLVSFRPPSEVLEGERIHQWIGARYSVRSDTTDFDRLRRQQALVVSLFESGFEFEALLTDPSLVSVSSEKALAELRQVNGSWRLETLDDVIAATVDGKMVLLRRGRPGQLRRAVPILMYHRVGDPPAGWPWPGLYVTRDDLARHLRELEHHGYVAVTQRDLYEGWNAERELPAKPVVISFDDGHASVWHDAFPLMRKLGWPAVLNLAVLMLDRSDGMCADMVGELVNAGWELAAHSRAHPDLCELTVERLDEEVAGCRQDLARRFGVPVDFFCYPSGRFSQQVVAAVVGAGYLGATTTIEGLSSPANLYTMPRVRVSRGDSASWLVRHLEALKSKWQPDRLETPV